MRYGVLGRLTVTGDGGVVLVPGGRQGQLLAVLLACAGDDVPADGLVKLLWPGAVPSTAPRTLAAYVSRLRQLLGAQAISTTSDGWRLVVDGDAVDAVRFEAAAGAATQALRGGRWVFASESADRALAEWRGRPFEGYQLLEPCAAAAGRLDALRLQVQDDGADAALCLGHGADVVPRLELAVAAEPLREHRWVQLIRALHGSGRRAEALQVYTRVRRVLADELGLDPGQELQAAHRAVLADRPELPSVRPPTVRRVTQCPFRGLASYREQDADLLFGRDRLVRRVVSRLDETQVVCLVGASGSGKSSVLRAGVVPALRAGALPGSRRWRVTVMTPGDEPAARIAAARGCDLLVVDQLEELVTRSADAAQQRATVEALGALRGDGTRLVLALRADYWADLAAVSGWDEILAERSIPVGPVTEDELRAIVTGGADRAGLLAEPALVEAVAADAADRPAALPLVSTALARTWELRREGRLTVDAYRRAGGVSGAVAALAEEVWTSLDPDARRGARRAMMRLVGHGRGGRPVRRRVPAGGLGDDRATLTAVEALVRARMLVSDDDGVEVTHEALFTAWPRMSGWLEEDASGRRLLEPLTSAAAQWRDGGAVGDDLLRGPRLVATLDWARDHDDDLTDLERRFLTASRRAADADRLTAAHRTRRLRGLLAVTVTLLLGVAAATGVTVAAEHGAAAAALTSQAERLGVQAANEPRLDRALLMGAQAVQLHDDDATRGALLSTVLQTRRAERITAPGNRPTGVALSPDGHELYTSDNLGRVVALDPQTLALRRVLRQADGDLVNGLTVLPGGAALAEVDQLHGPGASLVLRSVRDGHVLARTPTLADGAQTAVSPDGRTISGSADAAGYLWQPATGSIRQTTGGLEFPTGFTSDGTRYATVSPADGAEIRDTATGAVLTRIVQASGTSVAALSPDGSLLAVSQPTGLIQLFDTTTGRQTNELSGHDNALNQLLFLGDGSELVSTDGSGTVVVWDVAHQTQRIRLHVGSGWVDQVAVSADATTLYVAEADGTVSTWDLTAAHSFGPVEPAPAVTAAAQGGGVAVEADETGGLWRVDPVTLDVRQVAVLDAPVSAVAVTPDGRTAAVSTDRGVTLADLSDSAAAPPLRAVGPHAGVVAMSFSPDGKRLALVADRTVTIVDRSGTARAHSTLDHGVGSDSVPGGVAWSADGTLLAAGQGDGSIVIVDPSTGARLRLLRGPALDTPPAVLFPVGHDLVTGFRDGTLRWWDADTGRILTGDIAATTNIVLRISSSADGRTLVVTGWDGSRAIIDDTTRRRILAMPPPPGDTRVEAFIDPAGHTLLTVETAGALESIDLDRTTWEQHACTVTGRHLTPAEWQQILPDQPYRPAC